MITVSEHSIEENLLTPGCWVLDLGSSTDFVFAKEMLNRGMKVISVDCNPKIESSILPDHINFHFERKAIIPENDFSEFKTMKVFNDTDAATTSESTNLRPYSVLIETINVETIKISEIMSKYNITEFEVIKIDIEGSEYDLLLQMNHPLSKQLSVEFHDFRDLNPTFPNNEIYYEQLMDKILPHYSIVKHEKTHHPGFAHGHGYNFWDSLFVKK